MTLRVEDMTAGQLKLYYAAKCQWHQADGVAALGYASRVSTEELRAAMASYEVAAACEDWATAEEALLSVVARSTAP